MISLIFWEDKNKKDAGYQKGFMNVFEIVSGYEENLIFINSDNFNNYVFSSRFMLV